MWLRSTYKQKQTPLIHEQCNVVPCSGSILKSALLTPWPLARVKAGPFFISDLKNWWVKCCAKNANIRLVPCGSGINCLLIRSFSARSLISGSSFLPGETIKNIWVKIWSQIHIWIKQVHLSVVIYCQGKAQLLRSVKCAIVSFMPLVLASWGRLCCVPSAQLFSATRRNHFTLPMM